MKRETRATRDERERRDGRDGWEHHVKEEPTGDIRSSKFRNPRTFDPDPSPVSPVPPVVRSYSEYPWPKATQLRYTQEARLRSRFRLSKDLTFFI